MPVHRVDQLAGPLTNGKRNLEIPPLLRTYLVRLAKPLHPHVRLFPRDRAWVRKWVQRICRRARVPVVCAHSMRGLHATLAIDARITPSAVAAALGHGSIRATMVSYADRGVVARVAQRRVLAALRVGGGKKRGKVRGKIPAERATGRIGRERNRSVIERLVVELRGIEPLASRVRWRRKRAPLFASSARARTSPTGNSGRAAEHAHRSAQENTARGTTMGPRKGSGRPIPGEGLWPHKPARVGAVAHRIRLCPTGAESTRQRAPQRRGKPPQTVPLTTRFCAELGAHIVGAGRGRTSGYSRERNLAALLSRILSRRPRADTNRCPLSSVGASKGGGMQDHELRNRMVALGVYMRRETERQMSIRDAAAPPAWTRTAANEAMVRLIDETDIETWLPSFATLVIEPYSNGGRPTLSVRVKVGRVLGQGRAIHLDGETTRHTAINRLVEQCYEYPPFVVTTLTQKAQAAIEAGAWPEPKGRPLTEPFRGEIVRKTCGPSFPSPEHLEAHEPRFPGDKWGVTAPLRKAILTPHEWARVIRRRREGRAQVELERTFRLFMHVRPGDRAVRVVRVRVRPDRYRVVFQSAWTLEPRIAQRIAAKSFAVRLRRSPVDEVFHTTKEITTSARSERARLMTEAKKLRDAAQLLGVTDETPTSLRVIEARLPFYYVPTVRDEWDGKPQEHADIRVQLATLRLCEYPFSLIAEKTGRTPGQVEKYCNQVLEPLSDGDGDRRIRGRDEGRGGAP